MHAIAATAQRGSEMSICRIWPKATMAAERLKGGKSGKKEKIRYDCLSIGVMNTLPAQKRTLTLSEPKRSALS